MGHMTYATSTTIGGTADATSTDVDRPATRYQVLAAMQVLDVLTTWVILDNFAGRAEGNPIVATFIEHSGLTMSMFALLVVKLAVVYVLWEKQTGVNLMSAIYGLVLFNNVLVLGLSVL